VSLLHSPENGVLFDVGFVPKNVFILI
jgi:hypothetical protein